MARASSDPFFAAVLCARAGEDGATHAPGLPLSHDDRCQLCQFVHSGAAPPAASRGRRAAHRADDAHHMALRRRPPARRPVAFAPPRPRAALRRLKSSVAGPSRRPSRFQASKVPKSCRNASPACWRAWPCCPARPLPSRFPSPFLPSMSSPAVRSWKTLRQIARRDDRFRRGSGEPSAIDQRRGANALQYPRRQFCNGRRGFEPAGHPQTQRRPQRHHARRRADHRRLRQSREYAALLYRSRRHRPRRSVHRQCAGQQGRQFHRRRDHRHAARAGVRANRRRANAAACRRGVPSGVVASGSLLDLPLQRQER